MDQTTDAASTQALPNAAIICIAIGGYIIVVGLLLILRQCLMDRGVFTENCCFCCGSGEGLDCCNCGECCMMYCNCCRSPDLEACCDSICPTRRRMDCADLILCQCCMDNDCCQCCYSDEPLCDVCRESMNMPVTEIVSCEHCVRKCLSCRMCQMCECICTCEPPTFNNLNCCCFQINMRDNDPPGSYGYSPARSVVDSVPKGFRDPTN